MISKLPLLLMLVTVFGSAASVEDEVKDALNKQVAAWNRGDTDAFLEGYASDTVFVGEKMTPGLEDLKKRYQEHYPTRAAMGKLAFYDLEIHSMGKDYAYVIGRWQLDRDKEGGGNVSGVYSLVFRKTAIGWKIVLDHSN
jgi:ketosteroid isomerase-like protein